MDKIPTIARNKLAFFDSSFLSGGMNVEGFGVTNSLNELLFVGRRLLPIFHTKDILDSLDRLAEIKKIFSETDGKVIEEVTFELFEGVNQLNRHIAYCRKVKDIPSRRARYSDTRTEDELDHEREILEALGSLSDRSYELFRLAQSKILYPLDSFPSAEGLLELSLRLSVGMQAGARTRKLNSSKRPSLLGDYLNTDPKIVAAALAASSDIPTVLIHKDNGLNVLAGDLGRAVRDGRMREDYQLYDFRSKGFEVYDFHRQILFKIF